MARLSKAQIKAHEAAVALLAKERLTDDEREFVLDNWQESANHVNSAAGAFFTPSGLASDLAIYSYGTKVIDLCAGIGCLGLWTWWRGDQRPQVTCVEVNPAYVEIGRKLFPEAEWICASVEEFANRQRGTWDVAISNPPFGKTAKIKGPRYSGEDDLAVVDIASDIADYGVFILPVMSVPFEFSGLRGYRERPSAKHDRFLAATHIQLRCESIDCAYHADGWRGVKPKVELVSADFIEARQARRPKQANLDLAA
jgi:predicted RNA methylase